jgi:hypothetical protein
MNRFIVAIAACLLGLASGAQTRIVALEIEKTKPLALGTSFGGAGEYVRIADKARGELGPANPVNNSIVNLDEAPRNARGVVEYETDLFSLRPADPAKGNGTLPTKCGSHRIPCHPRRGGGSRDQPDRVIRRLG